jgi:hypothetical protein
MVEEVLEIGLESGITCPDGRHFLELICKDVNGHKVNVILPISGTCKQEVCDQCSKHESCEIMCPVDVELGRKIIIRRE